MNGSVRSICTAGVAVIGASAIAIAPSVVPPAPRPPAIELTAAVQPMAQQPAQYFSQLIAWGQQVFWPSVGQPPPTPPTIAPTPTPGSVPSGLEGAYHAVEPWVRYGFELATYAVGWVPYVGWLSGQIMIFYNFGERIVHAVVHNTLDWLNGNGTFAQNVIEGVQWTIDAFIQLGIDEWNFFLPPLPPLPPGAAGLSAQLNSVRDTLLGTVVGALQGLSDRLPSHDPEPPAPVALPGTTLSQLAKGSAAPTIAADVSSLPPSILDALKPADPATARTRATADSPKIPLPPLDAVSPKAPMNGQPRTLGRVPGAGAQVSNTVKGVQDRVTDIANGVRNVKDNGDATPRNTLRDTAKQTNTTKQSDTAKNTPKNSRSH